MHLEIKGYWAQGVPLQVRGDPVQVFAPGNTYAKLIESRHWVRVA